MRGSSLGFERQHKCLLPKAQGHRQVLRERRNNLFSGGKIGIVGNKGLFFLKKEEKVLEGRLTWDIISSSI